MAKSTYSREYREIIKRLREARLEAGLKQAEVAKRLGKSQSYISKIERSERRIDIVELMHLAAIYKKDLSFFV